MLDLRRLSTNARYVQGPRFAMVYMLVPLLKWWKGHHSELISLKCSNTQVFPY